MSLHKQLAALFAGVLFSCALVVTSSTQSQADTVVSSITVGASPQGVAVNPAGTFAYVTNSDSNSVSKINLSNDTVVSSVTVGSSPQGVAINPAGTFAYVANYSSNSVSKINLSNDTVVSSITVGSSPQGVAINPAGTFAYVTNSNSNSVSKINLSNDTVVATITVYGFWADATQAQPKGVAINPAGTFAYVTHVDEENGSVSKINLATDTVVARIRNTRFHWDMAINPAGTFAYVGNWSSANTVSKINLATDTVVATIAVGECPNGVAINPAGTFAYVTNQCGSGSVSKINLATDTAITIPIGGNRNPRGVAINPAGTFAYVALFSTPGEISKIALTATDPQSITFSGVSTQLLGAKTVALSASASSNLTIAFTSATPTICTVSGSIVTMVAVGDCSINANQAGGSGWDAAAQVSRTFEILPSPPVGESGVSIKDGASYSNSKQVTLNLIWPEYATSVRISNDGGFAASKTQTKELAASIDWELDDSVKGIYTKVVYVRFNGVADTTKTYSDDIILDTTAPTIETSSAVVASSSIDVSLKATDDITGVDKVELKNGSSTATKDYAANLSVPMKDLGLAVSSASVRKLGTSSIEIRVSDKAGNWSAYKTLSVSGAVTTPSVTTPSVTTPTVTTPTVTTKKAVTAKSIAVYAKLKVLSTSKVLLKVVPSSAKYCKVSGTTLKGLKAGSCKVTVTVTPKKGRAISKTVTLKVTK